jgi:hypothetical protein
LKNELSVYWKSLIPLPVKAFKKKSKNIEQIKGQVKKILNNNEKGMNGFITHGGTKSIYFNLNKDNLLITKLKVGSNINFNIISQKEASKEKAIIIELNGSGKRYGYNEENIHDKLLSYGFLPYFYNSFNRKLELLEHWGTHNSIYIRDLAFVENRIKSAPRIHINNMSL